ncbi:hypothetical protein [Corallococcus carmarthensis]|uniref:hypothetical protein n=1 Tax=Corallococcus carmarthensis TaxID=2316728 RepID=UPI00131594DA|nr:hypothetical protein [Corallococcus carmarthensis]
MTFFEKSSRLVALTALAWLTVGSLLPSTTWAACTPVAEVCNGRDDDCDGLVDEGSVCRADWEEGTCTGCVPYTCQGLGKNCGPMPDGCGGWLNCGTCGAGVSCADNVCQCEATVTCASAGASCGSVQDGCGTALNCGTCATGATCVGNQCVCTPATCQSLGKNCGTVADGCGETLNCGMCASGSSCTNNVCQCTPANCTSLGASCGLVSDGCGGTLNCGTCAQGSNCINKQCVTAPVCPAGSYLCCDGSCSTNRLCPGVSCEPGPVES